MPKEAHTGTYYRTASIQKTLPDEKKMSFRWRRREEKQQQEKHCVGQKYLMELAR